MGGIGLVLESERKKQRDRLRREQTKELQGGKQGAGPGIWTGDMG